MVLLPGLCETMTEITVDAGHLLSQPGHPAHCGHHEETEVRQGQYWQIQLDPVIDYFILICLFQPK